MLILLAGTLAAPVGFSYAASNETVSSSDKASSQVSTNETAVNETDNLGQQVSDFVHQAIADFKQQREDTLKAMKDCHEKLQNAAASDRDKIREDCKANLKSIREKYKDERKHYQELFKEFRDDIKVLIKEARGMHLEKMEKEAALKHMKETRAKNKQMENAGQHMGMGGNMTMGLKTRNNTNCVNPPYGPKIC